MLYYTEVAEAGRFDSIFFDDFVFYIYVQLPLSVLHLMQSSQVEMSYICFLNVCYNMLKLLRLVEFDSIFLTTLCTVTTFCAPANAKLTR